ncbi:hypothetical protein [Amycolatopsis balhimycina]|uniref:hypothetical protein n=1 Tax=Amycolatopsis balhimycina TaxID=208443 RepID=UPI000F7824F1|nr:hypothetical protein [Amycolatopsis balhimycina]
MVDAPGDQVDVMQFRMRFGNGDPRPLRDVDERVDRAHPATDDEPLRADTDLSAPSPPTAQPRRPLITDVHHRCTHSASGVTQFTH